MMRGVAESALYHCGDTRNMPYAYAVTTTADAPPALLDNAESYDILNGELRFYEKTSRVGDRVALFNWAHVIQVTPLTEDEYIELADEQW